ncbi:MAG: hypothetical protein U0183_25320 [Polyangiaceae bacterium]
MDYALHETMVVAANSPGTALQGWAARWKNLHDYMVAEGHVFEVVSLICARWEFLGALYRGQTDKSGWPEAVAFTDAFCPASYMDLQDWTGQGGGSDLFTQLRNKPLHGMVPAASVVAPVDPPKLVLRWEIGASVGVADHMTVSTFGFLRVNPGQFCHEFDAAVAGFAKLLTTNNTSMNDPLGVSRLPVARFQRAFFGRFCPRGLKCARWVTDGEKSPLNPIPK